MKRLALVGLGLAISGWGIVSALGGCSDDPAPAAPAGTSSGDPGDDDDGTSGNNGTSGTVTPPTDAGTDTGGGQGATPGKIACGASACDAGNGSECCWPNYNQDAAVCAPLGCNFAEGIELACDDKADCTGANKCCYELGETTCEATCAGTGLQLCRTTAECGDAGTCAERTCTFGDGKKFKFRMCGTLAAPNDPVCN